MQRFEFDAIIKDLEKHKGGTPRVALLTVTGVEYTGAVSPDATLPGVVPLATENGDVYIALSAIVSVRAV